MNKKISCQQIPASIIGRIEVTKGASSVLYGPNALGGVINIVTKKGVKGMSGVVSAEGGRGGYGRANATLNYGAENGVSLLGTIDYRSRDHLYFSHDYDPRVAKYKVKGPSGKKKVSEILDDGGRKDNSDLDALTLWTRLGFAPNNNLETYLSLYHFNMERGRPFSDLHNKVITFKGGFSTFGRFDKYKDTGVDFGGRISVTDRWDLRTMAFYHHHEDDYTSYTRSDLKDKIATSTWDDDSWGISLFSDTDLGKFGLLSLTAQYRDDTHKKRKDSGFNWEKSHANTLTLAVEDTIQFGQFTAVLGLAYHDFDAEKIADLKGYTDDIINPMAGLTWTGNNGLKIFGSIAKKTRFPTFRDMEDGGVIYRLSPEQNINYTLGAGYTFFDKSQVVLSGFFNDIKDRIDKNAADEPANIDTAEIYGIELETDTQITSRLSFGLDWVLTHARNTSDDRESKYLTDVPDYTLVAALKYMIPNIETQLILRGTYTDSVIFDTREEEKENNTVVDLSLVKDWHNGFSLGGYIYNLLDADYYQGKGMACNGFDVKVVARYEF